LIDRWSERQDVLAETLRIKLGRLRETVYACGPAAVAISGGIDSTLLLKVACDELGVDKVLALFAHSVLQPAGERAHVFELCTAMGCRLQIMEADPLNWSDFVENPPDRCYRCKKRIYSNFLKTMAPFNMSALMDGTNTDDRSDTRPGLRALAELKVLTPLADVGLRKQEIRQLGRHLGLPNWKRPSASCLATRIPAGRPITPALLDRVARCEEILHSLGFYGCRARLVGDDVLIELATGDTARFVDPSVRNSIVKRISGLGVDRVLLDLSERRS
jgi:uncharacterized protein